MRHVFCRKVVFLLAALLVVCGMSARKPIKTLLITGQNNHNWQVSHVVLKQILENSGRFSVDFAVSPEAGNLPVISPSSMFHFSISDLGTPSHFAFSNITCLLFISL